LAAEWRFFIAPDIVFTPRLKYIGVSQATVAALGKDVLDNFIFHIGLAEIPSYWKRYVPKQLRLSAVIWMRGRLHFGNIFF